MRIVADRPPETLTPIAPQAEGDFAAWLSLSEPLPPVVSFEGAGLFRSHAAAAGKAAPPTVSWASLALGDAAGFQARPSPDQVQVPPPGEPALTTSPGLADRDFAIVRRAVAPTISPPNAPSLAATIFPSAGSASETVGPAPQAGRPAAARALRPLPSEAAASAFSIHVEDGAVQVVARLGTVCVAERRQLRSRVEGIVATLGYSLDGLTIDGFNLPPAGGSTEEQHGVRRG